ncbi:hypothetical protein [Pengzhenrongella sp.]|jgi:flagellar assembly protein FliH|uniref:hypothetical protein n=1 Tax=Pengzhenrongella sp. TaxID=2888820 RepID=UPI002F95CB69
MSEHSGGTRFRPAALGGVLGARSEQATEEVRAAGWASGWAAGTRAATQAAANHRRMLDEAQQAAERTRSVQLDAALALLFRAADAVSARTVPVLADAFLALEEGALDLALALLGRELDDDDPDAASRARAALARALGLPSEVGVHTVRLNPVDLRLLTGLGLVASLPPGVQLVADASLRPGDAMSEFPDGYLDARIGTAVERARRAFEDPR